MDKFKAYLPYIQMLLEAAAAGVAGYLVSGKQGASAAMITYLYGKLTKRPMDKN